MPDVPVLSALILFPAACLLAARRPDYGAPVLMLASVFVAIAGTLWMLDQPTFMERIEVAFICLVTCIGSAVLAAVIRTSDA